MVNGFWVEERGAGRPVVLVHPWTLCHRTWENQVAALAGSLRTIAYDLRGHGRSLPEGPHDLETHAADLARLLDALELRAVTLVGWSMGGQIATLCAARHPERIGRLALVGVHPRYAQGPDWPLGVGPDMLAALGAAMLADRARFSHDFFKSSLGPTASPQLLDWICRFALETPLAVALESFQSVMATDLRAVLPALKMPLTIVHGAHDAIPVAAAEWITAQVPGARLVLMAGSGHFPPMEEPAAVSRLIAEL
jgi:pimeloyl-ACP methyl ester carboxylesterase